MFWTYRSSCWPIETRPCGKAKPSNILALFTRILLKFRYLTKRFIVPAMHLFIIRYSPATAHCSALLCLYITLSVKQNEEVGKAYWHILSYLSLIPLFLLVSIALTITNTISACCFDFHIGRINQGMFGGGMTSRCSGLSGSSTPLSRSISISLSASQSSCLSFGLSKSRFECSQFSLSKMLSGVPSSSLSTGWQSILLIRWTFNIWVHPPWRTFGDKAGGKGDLSANLNAAAPSCWNSDQDAVTISAVSEKYPKTVLCLFWAGNSFCLAHTFWRPYHISKTSWTLAILCKFSFFCLSHYFRVVFCVHFIQCCVITCRYSVIGSSKLPNNDFFASGLTHGFWLPPADTISHKGKTGLHSDTKWYESEFVLCHIREIG